MKLKFTTELLRELLAASPEGFFPVSELDNQRLGIGSRKAALKAAAFDGSAALEGNYVYDPSRLTAEQVRERSQLFPGILPQVDVADPKLTLESIKQRMITRQAQLDLIADAAMQRLMQAFENTIGVLPMEELLSQPDDATVLQNLMGMHFLRRDGSLVFDPLRITRASMTVMKKRESLAPVRTAIIASLTQAKGQTLPRLELVEQYGAKNLQAILDGGGFYTFSVPIPLGESVWITLADAELGLARHVALDAVQPKDDDWQTALDYAGDVLRADVPHHKQGEILTRREQALERTYLVPNAAAQLGMRRETLEGAIRSRQIIAFVDPEGNTRIPAYEVEELLNNSDLLNDIADFELIRIRELQIVFDEPRASAITNRLGQLSYNGNKVRWGQIRNLLWDEPITLAQFRALYRERKTTWFDEREEQRKDNRRRRGEARELERKRSEEERRHRDELRARLLAAFPAWQHAGRADQQIIFHVGPPNSGKTHNALDRLASAGSGWYLAPLRLLAFEVFDRLNKRGVLCNLLTGEEFIPVPGATITAATIEMFNPNDSGNCVVIDEAQMLSDSDRGWAWTRALMEAQSPEIYVIGPPHARNLIERLAQTAAIPLLVQDHERLAPLQVAAKPWSLAHMPERTIVVAFSRQMVLRLKTSLEQYGRKVSVVYGNLPPEVRRRQADRFAEGQTDLCVATDAVGMGLNLPADRVCFYEISKFDGKTNRVLTPSEVHQIGGRAGRFGLSIAGEIGAVNRRDLNKLRALYEIAPATLKKARVAPDVTDLELLPGSLSRRFAQWRELQSIPESLRDVLEPADIDERIALARMLSDKEVEQLGLATAVQLVNAPTRENSRLYWLECAKAILKNHSMPLPPEATFNIRNRDDLDEVENAISCADIYLWLSSRPEFSAYGPQEMNIRETRIAWSMSIDAALLRKVDTAARCIACHRRLPIDHRFTLCDNCYQTKYNWY